MDSISNNTDISFRPPKNEVISLDETSFKAQKILCFKYAPPETLQKMHKFVKNHPDFASHFSLFEKYVMHSEMAEALNFQQPNLQGLNDTELKQFILDYVNFIKDKFIPLTPKQEDQTPVLKGVILVFFPDILPDDLEKMTTLLYDFFQSNINDDYSLFSSFITTLALLIENKNSFIDFLAQRSEWSQPHLDKLIDLAIHLNAPLTSDALIWGVVMQNRNMLEKLLSQGKSPSLSDQEKHLLIDRLANSENPHLFKLFINHKVFTIEDALDGSPCCLKKFILRGQTEAIKWLFEYGLTLQDQTLAEELLEAAASTCNLEIIELIWNSLPSNENIPFPISFSEEELQVATYTSIVETIKRLWTRLQSNHPTSSVEEEQKVKDKLLTLALRTPLPILSQFIKKHYPKSKLSMWLKEDIIPALAIQARLPNEWDMQIPNTLATQLNRIKAFVQFNQKFIENIVPKLPSLSFTEFLQASIKYRELSGHYIDLRYRTLPHQILTTSLTTCSDHFSPVLNLPEPAPYTKAWNQANLLSLDILHDPSLLVRKGNKLEFLYKLPTDEFVVVTTLRTEPHFVAKWSSWRHAEPEIIMKCNDHLNTLHKQVVTFKLTQENQTQFNELVAETYYLMTSLAHTNRGSAHNAKLWLLAVYHLHQLPPPVPKLEYFFLDTMMMTMTLNQVKALWTTFFEPVQE